MEANRDLGKMTKKLKKITSQRTYNRYLIDIVSEDYYPCKTCGRPVQHEYVCQWCDDNSPDDEEVK